MSGTALAAGSPTRSPSKDIGSLTCNGHQNRGLAPCRSRAAHVDLAGDGGGDQGGSAFLQQFDPTFRFGGQGHGP